MKMSDVFELPLQRAVNELAVIDKNDGIVGWADAFAGETARDCFVEAVNNHEKLVELLLEHKEFNEAMHEMEPIWTIKESIRLHKATCDLLKELSHEV